MFEKLKKINLLINKRHKRNLILLALLLSVGFSLEIFSLALILPLVTMFSNAEYILNNPLLDFFTKNILDISPLLFFKLFLIGVVITFIFKTLFLVFINTKQFQLLANLNAYLNSEFLRKYMNQDYSFYLNRNSNVVVKNIQIEIPILMRFIHSLLTLIIEIGLTLAVVITLFFIEPIAAISVGGFLFILSFLFFQLTKRKLDQWGKEREILDGSLTKILIEGLGGIKELKVLNRENFFTEYFTQKTYSVQNIHAKHNIVSSFPRYFLEVISIIGLVGFVFVIILQNNNYANLLASLSVFVAATFRLIPSINKIIASLQNMRYQNSSLDLLVNEFKTLIVENKELDDNSAITFDRSIRLNGLNFKYYNGGVFVLKNLNLTINKGEMIGIIGASGSGKTTLIDILLGLHKPGQGEILIDDVEIKGDNLKNWTKKIGYVPQNIFLIDDTITNNIALGIPAEKINKQNIASAVKAAQLDHFISNLPSGLETNVGEKGIQISGGQIQRIGIARALYNNPEILILDEATSALDNKTEIKFIDSIEKLKNKQTIIMIAHRITSLKNCNKIFELTSGVLNEKSLKL